MSNTSLTLIRGIPGSGKTTFARKLIELFPSPSINLEADQFFIQANGDYLFNKAKIGDAHDWCQAQTLRNLKNGVSVIVSNTFIRKWELFPYVAMAHDLKIPLTTITMEDNGWKSIHNVPPEVIERMKTQFEF